MRTDHILKDDADAGPPGLPPMPKHAVSIHTSIRPRGSKALVSLGGSLSPRVYHHFTENNKLM